MFSAVVFTIIGLVILVGGAEYLVKGASSIAKKMRISPLVIGLTIVALGTSAPELIVNVISAVKGSTDLAIGNILGSNNANILLILGITAILYPIKVKSNTIWKEIPFALLAIILVLILGNDSVFLKNSVNIISRFDGVLFLSLFLLFLYYVYRLAKTTREATEKIFTFSWSVSVGFTLGGLVALFLGGKLLVDNAIILARLAGLSEALIGLTVVAIGTSLPELATSVVAAWHNHDDLAVGNIVGSNIFNILWVLGLTSTINPIPFSAFTNFNVLVSIFSTILLFSFMFIHSKQKIDRWQGVVLLGSYVVYLSYLVNRG